MGIVNIITHLTNEALYLAVIASLPAIIASLVVGLSIALFSATTQIQEQTLSFAPKMIAVYATLAATAGWVGGMLISFTAKCFTEIIVIPLD